MKSPSFSICIPNYNYGHYIGETIQSVLDQTYQNFEIIVADNASTDNSVEVVRAFKADRIRLIRNRYNIGFAPNLQRAAMVARNDYINLLSSDDKMKPDALAAYVEMLRQQGERANQTVLMSDVEIIDGSGSVSGLITRDEHTFEALTLLGDGRNSNSTPCSSNMEFSLHRGRDLLTKTLKRLRTFASFLSIVYPRELWKSVEGYNSVRTIGPDKHFNYKLLALDPDVIYVHRPLFQYRMHPSPNYQAARQTLKQQIDDYLYTIELSDEFLDSVGLARKDLTDALLNRVCLKTGLTQLVYGSYTHAFRMLAFSLAAYPAETLKKPRAYALAGLLLLGPFSRLLAKPLYQLYKKFNHDPNPKSFVS